MHPHTLTYSTPGMTSPIMYSDGHVLYKHILPSLTHTTHTHTLPHTPSHPHTLTHSTPSLSSHTPAYTHTTHLPHTPHTQTHLPTHTTHTVISHTHTTSLHTLSLQHTHHHTLTPSHSHHHTVTPSHSHSLGLYWGWGEVTSTVVGMSSASFNSYSIRGADQNVTQLTTLKDTGSNNNKKEKYSDFYTPKSSEQIQFQKYQSLS